MLYFLAVYLLRISLLEEIIAEKTIVLLDFYFLALFVADILVGRNCSKRLFRGIFISWLFACFVFAFSLFMIHIFFFLFCFIIIFIALLFI